MNDNVKETSFEDQLSELEAIVDTLDKGDTPLQDMLEEYERGIKLADACRKFLDEAEQKIIDIGKANTVKREPSGAEDNDF